MRPTIVIQSSFSRPRFDTLRECHSGNLFFFPVLLLLLLLFWFLRSGQDYCFFHWYSQTPHCFSRCILVFNFLICTAHYSSLTFKGEDVRSWTHIAIVSGFGTIDLLQQILQKLCRVLLLCSPEINMVLSNQMLEHSRRQSMFWICWTFLVEFVLRNGVRSTSKSTRQLARLDQHVVGGRRGVDILEELVLPDVSVSLGSVSIGNLWQGTQRLHNRVTVA
mmetsp:Transcript_18415/g.34269  ORF Transcript_18415/g.34269 Transcript_18415/m.34269 type:complete len:220 (-) Transcript_18415:55-714(-)